MDSPLPRKRQEYEYRDGGMVGDALVRNLIREGKTFQIPSMMQVGKGAGNVMLGDALVAQRMAAGLLDRGIYAVGFFHPVVPQGAATGTWTHS